MLHNCKVHLLGFCCVSLCLASHWRGFFNLCVLLHPVPAKRKSPMQPSNKQKVSDGTTSSAHYASKMTATSMLRNILGILRIGMARCGACIVMNPVGHREPGTHATGPPSPQSGHDVNGNVEGRFQMPPFECCMWGITSHRWPAK